MDEFVKSVITGAPNLIVALWVIWWLTRKIERSDALLIELVRQCYKLDEPEGSDET